MKANKPHAGNQIADFFESHFLEMGMEVVVFDLADHAIPHFMEDMDAVPSSIKEMVELFRSCDKHIWLSPLYHGGMVGAMKNCLDWLIISATEKLPYLSEKSIALVCWGYGGNAASGLDNMRTVANTLRAWTLPYSIPIVREDLFEGNTENISISYKARFQRMMALMMPSETIE